MMCGKIKIEQEKELCKYIQKRIRKKSDEVGRGNPLFGRVQPTTEGMTKRLSILWAPSATRKKETKATKKPEAKVFVCISSTNFAHNRTVDVKENKVNTTPKGVSYGFLRPFALDPTSSSWFRSCIRQKR